MSKVIEILDSDDDMNESEANAVTAAAVDEQQQQPNSEQTDENIIADNDVLTDAPNTDPILDEVTGCLSNAPATDNATVVTAKPRGRHARKSVHQTMRASPEMQFETISLDDEEDDAPTTTTASAASTAATTNSAVTRIAKAKPFKTTPKILANRTPSAEELMSLSCDAFVSRDDVNALIRQIAEERVRINFLLASYSMPDINFSLYTQYDRLKFQFEDRLKQRKMRSWNTRIQEFKQKKRNVQKQQT